MKIGYTRVSTREQAQDSSALDQQTHRIKSAGATVIFCDVESGKSFTRKEFKKMIALCNEGRVSELIITRIDRLGRSVIGIHQTIEALQKLNIKINVLDSPVDPSSAYGWYSINQMAGLAELESRMLSERINNGMEYFRLMKKASPRPPFGYARVNEKYEPDLEEFNNTSKWAIAQQAIKFFLNNGTLRSLSQYLLEHEVKITPSGLRYWLLNPCLRGHTVYGSRGNIDRPEKWTICENTHTPLISNLEYHKILKILETNKIKHCYGNDKKDKERYPLSGQIICANCGYKCFIKKRGSKIRVRCKQHEISGSLFCENKFTTYLDNIIYHVDSVLHQRYLDVISFTESEIMSDSEAFRDNPLIADQERQLRSLRQLPKSPIIDGAIASTLLEIQRLKSLQTVQQEISQELKKTLISSFSDLDFWQNIPWKDKCEIYKELIKSVSVSNGEIIEIELFI
ncbi:fdxN element excision recombinase XisF [Dolichospermum circinale]|uniref:fdxN element excision recombinase XisF n=1 Tax=Dolichospermum circinale TaxID=109265 RepID=UPI00232EBB89|nr:fdxN element excision recombinase XisF [Dolichospermum circinale]MDB9454659.1 fdxN element excision recombinase XisF [Dolichospermum circinale CS-541/06]MDB9461450.1 fdxN element excision recombinase XisF [Dolichospermum circinale CS-541/04]MDB9546461.1 fdxN element excision recombinase XisF [Dolichospermum circinale CS-1031]